MIIHDPAPPWNVRSSHVRLWHGCTENELNSIRQGIDLGHASVDTDFGRGFYTTTIERQARHWAWLRFYSAANYPSFTGNQPVIVYFDVQRSELARLNSLHFVNANYADEDYWSLVQHCRLSIAPHANDHMARRSGWYDLVSGPVAAFWEQRSAMKDADQISFHTDAAIDVLNQVMQNGGPGFGWQPVV